MDKGRIIASGSNDELKNSIELSERISIVIEDIDKEIINCFHQLEGVMKVEVEDNIIHISYKSKGNNLSQLMDYLNQHHIKYNRLYSERPTLNDVFLELTGKELRD